jgi:hypothetical protein
MQPANKLPSVNKLGISFFMLLRMDWIPFPPR